MSKKDTLSRRAVLRAAEKTNNKMAKDLLRHDEDRTFERTAFALLDRLKLRSPNIPDDEAIEELSTALLSMVLEEILR